jgi:hypothetical protein
MATIGAPGNLQTAQTGNADSTNTIRDGDVSRPSAIRVVSTIGATPTVTVNILGSIDGTTFFNIPYALVTAPSTYVLTALTITTAVTSFYLLQIDQPWNFCKLNMSANTNVTLTSDYL